MATVHHLQASFNGAQISKRLHARSDLAIHAVAVAEMTNAIPTIEGAFAKRPGTYMRAIARASASRLIPFIFNATQAYVLEWSEGKVRFVTNNALVLDGAEPLALTVPYAAADAARICHEQSGDVLYLAHGSHPPAVLSRTGSETFDYGALDLVGGPFGDVNGDETMAITVTGNLAEGGIVTLAGAPIFAPGHVGGRIRVEANDFSEVKAWQEGIDGIVIGDFRRSEGRVYKAKSVGRTGYNQPVHDRGEEWDGDATGQDVNENGPFGVLWQYVHDRFGIVKITGYTDASTVTGKVERRIPELLQGKSTFRWAHGLFSAAAGWPQHVCLWRGRLWWWKDFELAGSVAGDYRDYNEYDTDGTRQADMAIRLRLDLTDKPLWVRADRNAMIIGTARGEYAVQPINPAEGVTSSNLQVTRQRRHGSSPVWPTEAGGEIFFVQRGGRKIRGSSYDFGEDRYSARWANVYARHATQAGVLELAYQAESEELLWALRGDGTAAVHPYGPEQEVKGWAQGLKMDGAAVRSFCSIPSPDGGRDDLWLLVERGESLTLEQLGDWWDDEGGGAIEDAFFVDSGLTYRGDPATHFAGLEHLAGQTAVALADGLELAIEVDESGAFVLDTAASVVHAGKRISARVVLLEPEIQQRDGTSAGRLRRTVNAIANVLDSLAPKIGVTSAGGALERIVKWLTGKAGMPTLQPPFTGWSDPKMVGGSKDRNDRVVLEDDSPFPWIHAAIVRQIEVE